MDLKQELEDKGIDEEEYQAVFEELAIAYGIDFDEEKISKLEGIYEKDELVISYPEPNTIEWDLKDLNKDILRDLLHGVTLELLTEHREELQIEKIIEE